MKIMVTGGAGFIGSHTCKLLAESGHSVTVYDNLSTGHRDFVKWGDFVYGDIRDTENLRQAMKNYRPDAIIHFAGYSCVGESVIEPGKYIANNVGGTLSILEAMRQEGVNNIVMSSTCAVYGQPEQMPISEDCPLNPINPYGESKLFMEKMLASYALACGISWLSLRYFNAAGSSPDGEIGELHEPETHLIPRVIFAALGEIPHVDIYGTDYPTPDATCIRDYIHVDDLALAHKLGAEKLMKKSLNKALNLGTGKGYSVRQIIDGVKEVSGRDVPVRELERRPGDPPSLVANANLSRQELDWQPRLGLKDILKDAWNYLSRHAG